MCRAEPVRMHSSATPLHVVSSSTVSHAHEGAKGFVHFHVTKALVFCVQEGAEVVLADIDGPAAEEAAAEIQQATTSKCTGGPSACFTTACPGSLPLPAARPFPVPAPLVLGEARLQAALCSGLGDCFYS